MDPKGKRSLGVGAWLGPPRSQCLGGPGLLGAVLGGAWKTASAHLLWRAHTLERTGPPRLLVDLVT